MGNKELQIVLWESNNNEYTLKEYIYEKMPSFDEIDKIVKGRKIVILIGENPSKAEGIVCDETNMYLRIKIYTLIKYNGYILLNIFSEMATKFQIKKEKIDLEYIKVQCLLLNNYDFDIILFYGKNVVTKINKWKIDVELKKAFQDYMNEIKEHQLYITMYNSKFIHPALPGKKNKYNISNPKKESDWMLL